MEVLLSVIHDIVLSMFICLHTYFNMWIAIAQQSYNGKYTTLPITISTYDLKRANLPATFCVFTKRLSELSVKV